MVRSQFPGRGLAFVSCVPEAYLPFLSIESRSFLEPLSEVVRSGVNVLVWAGDLGKSSPLRLVSSHKKYICIKSPVLMFGLQRLDLQLVRLPASRELYQLHGQCRLPVCEARRVHRGRQVSRTVQDRWQLELPARLRSWTRGALLS